MYGYSALSSIESGTYALSGRGDRYSDHAWPCHTGSSTHSLCCESLSEERSAGNPHATFCGSRRRVTASGHPVSGRNRHDNGSGGWNVCCWGRSRRCLSGAVRTVHSQKETFAGVEIPSAQGLESTRNCRSRSVGRTTVSGSQSRWGGWLPLPASRCHSVVSITGPRARGAIGHES